MSAVTLDFQEQLQRSLGEVYRIERELGGGGMSRVFVAVETALQRKVVVKVLLPDLAAGVSVERFRREIYLAAQLQHPHIVPLLSAGESGGLPYFTMPYVEGESLRARIIRERELPVPQAVRVLRDVASALAYAHEQGVVHRDIKPDNVLLSHGIAVVTDFGVAKAVTASTAYNPAAGHPGLTSLGVTLGTPHYMAPEQGTADPGMDHRVDLYAFGVTAYEMLTGDPPFTGPSPHAVLGAHLATAPVPITTRRPGIPPLLGHIIMRCLEKRPADRPQSATEIINALDTLTTPTGGTVPIAAIRRSGAPLHDAARRYGPRLAAAVALGAVALLVWSRRGTEPGANVADTVAAVARATPPAGPAPPAPVVVDSTVKPAPEPAPPEVSAPVERVRRPEPQAPSARPTRPTPEDSVLLARLRSVADSARGRARAAGVDETVMARGDSSVARADLLTLRRRTAEAAAELSTAATLWSQAAADARRAAPRPPAAAPVPPPVPALRRDTVPPAAPDPAPQIRALFDEYGRAIEARSLDAIRRTYPGLQPEQAREWEEFFRGVTDIKVELEVRELKVTGDAAEAGLAGVYLFTNPSTHRNQREPVTFRASLRREGGQWRITSLR